MLTRRIFLRGSAMAMAGAGSVPFWLGRAAATTQGKRKILVVIFQRGAADGLNMWARAGDAVKNSEVKAVARASNDVRVAAF